MTHTSFASRCLLLFAISILCLVPLAHCIKCWVCHSDSDPKCADPFDNNTLPIKDCREIKRQHLLEPEFEYDRLKRLEDEKRGIKTTSPKLMVATMCRKIRQKIHGNWRTIRDCAFIGSPGEGTGNEHHCLYRKGTYDIYLEYCTCDSKDGCNPASHLAPRIAFHLFAFIFAFFLLH